MDKTYLDHNNKEQLKKLQDAELQILNRFVEICNKHNLVYYLCSGTLLGAVRHKGFIPWDDDIDVTMPVKDYNRFLNVAESELGPSYFIQNYKTDKYFHFSYTKIRMNNTTFMPAHFKNIHSHQGIWLDIFPLINISGKLEYSVKRKLLTICNIFQMDDYVSANEKIFKEYLGPIGYKTCIIFFKVPKSIRIHLHSIVLFLVMHSFSKKYSTWIWGNITKIFPSYCFKDKNVFLTFEGKEYRVPSNYNKCLAIDYGDYMTLPPEEERYGHSNMILDFNNDYTVYS